MHSRGKTVKSRLKIKLSRGQFALLALGVACSGHAAPVDYLREVKPLLTEHCYKCHGASQQKSELRLDTAAFALKGGENGPASNPAVAARAC